ncbi:hypothetical protein Tco_1040070 [Tanacetum coccineum]
MKYRVLSKTTLNDQHTTLENLRQYVRKYWVMVETSSPQFVMAHNPLSFACGVICVFTAVLNLSVFLTILGHRSYLDCVSDYEWSMLAIYITQFTGVVVEDEKRLAVQTLKGISKSMDHLIQKAEKEDNNNLLKFLEKSIGFNGVANFDMDQVQPLMFVKLPNSWSLPIVTLTCIAIVLPNIRKDIVNSLCKYVGEGLVYTRLIEENLNSASKYVNIQKTAMSLWRGVEDSRKWLEHSGKIVRLQRKGELVENFSNELIAADSMYRISQTLLLSYKSSIKTLREEELFSLLHGMIADIMVACFTNIPRVITMKCHESVIEKREASVEAAAKLLGRTKEIINRLEMRKLPDMDPDKMAFIDEWRLHLKQSIP